MIIGGVKGNVVDQDFFIVVFVYVLSELKIVF